MSQLTKKKVQWARMSQLTRLKGATAPSTKQMKDDVMEPSVG
jgi:hypothetical protein